MQTPSLAVPRAIWEPPRERKTNSGYQPIPGDESDHDVERQLTDDFFRSFSKEYPSFVRFHPGPGEQFLDSPRFQAFMAIMIICNSIVIGFETDVPSWPHWDIVEGGFLSLFTIELALRMSILGRHSFFCGRSDIMWNLFDLIIVTLGLFDTVASAIGGKETGSATTVFRIVRLLRILRIFKVLRFLKQLYLLAYGLAEAAQAVFWVSILMTFVLYVCAILLVRSIGRPPQGDPHRGFLAKKFGNVPRSMFSLFVLMASPDLEDYEGEDGLLQAHPSLTCFLIVFTIFGSFGMIALLTGVISESMFEKNQLRIEEERSERETMRKWMTVKCRALFKMLSVDEDGQASREEVEGLLPVVQRLFDIAQVDYMREELEGIFRVMDTDGSGAISEDEFCHALVTLAAGVRSISLQEMFHVVCLLDGKIGKLEVELLKLGSSPRRGRNGGEMQDPTSLTSGRDPSHLLEAVQAEFLASSPSNHRAGSRAGSRSVSREPTGATCFSREVTGALSQTTLSRTVSREHGFFEAPKGTPPVRTLARELAAAPHEVPAPRFAAGFLHLRAMAREAARVAPQDGPVLCNAAAQPKADGISAQKMDELMERQRRGLEVVVLEAIKAALQEVLKEVRASSLAAAPVPEGGWGLRESRDRAEPTAEVRSPTRTSRSEVSTTQVGPLALACLDPASWSQGVDAQFRDRLAEVTRAHADALAKVVTLEAQAMLIRTSSLCVEGLGVLPPPVEEDLWPSRSILRPRAPTPHGDSVQAAAAPPSASGTPGSAAPPATAADVGLALGGVCGGGDGGTKSINGPSREGPQPGFATRLGSSSAAGELERGGG